MAAASNKSPIITGGNNAHDTNNRIVFPRSFQELFATWNRLPGAIPFAGGTSLGRGPGLALDQTSRYTLTLPSTLLSLDGLEELHRITRTERYIEIGAMVRLNEIIDMGKIVPLPFTQALKGMDSPQIRNIATIGGHICEPRRRLDAASPLVALDARYELRTAALTRWISASRFSSMPGPLVLNPQELLTRIRIPLEQWNHSVYKKFKTTENRSGGEGSGAMVFLVRVQKDILTDIRAVFAGETVIQDKNSESALTGRKLPLDKRDVHHFIELWETCLSGLESPGPMMRARILNFIAACVLELAD
jgi:CO/xanthine dehydrogenase FAD-binding subunit